MNRIFLDENKLSLEYIPSKLPFREKELEMLNVFFKSFIKEEKFISPRVLITGSIGTGKTALCKLFGMNAEKEAKKHNIKIIFIYLNCKINKTLFTLIRSISEKIKFLFPTKGLSNEELMNRILDYLDNKNIRLILALDEIDFLIKEEGSEAIYFLTRIGEVRKEKSLKPSLICILRNPEVLRSLDESSRSTLQSNFIHLKEYDEEQLYGILKYRVSEAFYENSILDETLKFIAEESSDRGDARYAIEILWRAGKFAEAENSKIVTPEHVRKAYASIYPTLNREYLIYLSIHEKLILLALSRSLKEKEEAYITSSELNEFYKIVCEEYNIEPRSYRMFWEYLQKLEDLGYIRIKVLSKEAKGRKSYISLLEIPASILENELSKIIKFKKEMIY
jgi:cell division control protein 6